MKSHDMTGDKIAQNHRVTCNQISFHIRSKHGLNEAEQRRASLLEPEDYTADRTTCRYNVSQNILLRSVTNAVIYKEQ